MKELLLAFLIGALIAGASAWKVQDWRIAAIMGQAAEDQVEQVRHVLKAERASHVQASNAVAAARAREGKLRRAADDLRTERDRLRDTSADAVRVSEQSHAACLERVGAFRDVFDQCAARYGELAEKAGRHVSDVRTLIEAWPTDVPRVADSDTTPLE